MSIQEMKRRVHQLVDEAEDEATLEQVSMILSGGTERDLSDDLTDEQLAKIEQAREDVRTGNYLTFEEHKRKIEQWLKTADNRCGISG